MSHDHSDAKYPVPARRSTRGNTIPAPYARSSSIPTANSNENLISPAFIAWVFQQWWMVVIPTGLLLAVGAGVLVMLSYIPKYEAAALLMIEDTTPFVAFSGGGARESQRYIQTQLELLRSPVVLEPVLSRSEIAGLSELTDVEDRVKFLRDRMAIRQVGGSELYNIAYISPSPQAAAKVVNAAIAEYLTIQSGDESQRSQRVVDILEEERRRRGLEVERLRKRVVDIAKEVTGKDPFGGNDVDFKRALTPVGGLFQSLTEADVEREVLQAQLRSLIDMSVSPDTNAMSPGLLEFQVENQEEIRARQKAIAEIQALMEQVKNESERLEKNPNWKNSPNYVALKTEMTQRTKDLETARTKLRDVIVTQLKEQHKGEREQQIAKMKESLKALDARREMLSKRFADQVKELQSGGGKSVELEFARAELTREDKVFELIASRKLALQTELRAPARVQLRHAAIVPTVPLEPIPYKLLFLACSAAMAAPFGLATLREITVRRISDVEQLAQESGLRVLGEVASLPVRYVAVSTTKLSGRLRRDTYVFAESINSLRTNLHLAGGSHDPQVVAITSASPSEGKSSVAVSLAMSIANATEKPTLIIDGDMRSPVVASMLKAKNQPGLFEVLSKKCELDDAIQRVGESELYVIPGGRATRSTHSVVGMDEMKELLDQLRTRFSKIVVDTPPILGASESLVLSKSADAVLFCSLCNVSKARQVRLAIDRLEHAQVNIAGAVLSGTSAKRYEYIYGYYANRIEAGE